MEDKKETPEETNGRLNGQQLIHSFNTNDCSRGNFNGLTKREYFAGLAITSCSMVGMSNSEIKEYAKNAVILADEVLKELAKIGDP